MKSTGQAGSRSVGRRAVLTAGLVLTGGAPLGACTGDDEPADGSDRATTMTREATTAPPSGDAALAADALGDEEALLAFCTALVRRVPRDQRATVRAVGRRQRAIVSAMRDAMTDPDGSPAAPIRVPQRRPAMLRELTAVLAKAEEARLHDCLAAESGPFARLLASASASHAVAVEQVRALR